MELKLDAKALEYLKRHSEQNDYYDREVERGMQEEDCDAEGLPPHLQVEYAGLKGFFNALTFHDKCVRTYSWKNPQTEVYFRYPCVRPGYPGVYIDMYVSGAPSGSRLFQDFEREGLEFSYSMSENKARGAEIVSLAQLAAVLQIIHRHHAGYILPGNERWLADYLKMQGKAGEREYRDCLEIPPALLELPQPDCWI